MSETRRSSTEGDDFNTADLIFEARRPILIARHLTLVTEMEASLSERFLDDNASRPRLRAMIEELASESETARIGRTLKLLSEDEHYRDLTLQQALIDFLCLMREEGSIEIAALQIHAIGVYRTVRARLLQRQSEAPTLAELRELTTDAVGILGDPPAPVFGRIGVPQVYTRGFIEHTLKELKQLRRGEADGVNWEDEDSAAVLTREDREQVLGMPEGERAATLAFLIRDRIRSRFYRSVFLDYLSVDELDPRAEGQPATVLAWLQSMAETAHLFLFLQGQPTAQKAFRIARLTQKLVQLFEIYARVAQAQDDPRHREALASGKTREKLQYLARMHYPPITMSTELTLATMLCPFAVFVEFVQTHVRDSDFVLPPDPKH